MLAGKSHHLPTKSKSPSFQDFHPVFGGKDFVGFFADFVGFPALAENGPGLAFLGGHQFGASAPLHAALMGKDAYVAGHRAGWGREESTKLQKAAEIG